MDSIPFLKTLSPEDLLEMAEINFYYMEKLLLLSIN